MLRPNRHHHRRNPLKNYFPFFSVEHRSSVKARTHTRNGDSRIVLQLYCCFGCVEVEELSWDPRRRASLCFEPATEALRSAENVSPFRLPFHLPFRLCGRAFRSHHYVPVDLSLCANLCAILKCPELQRKHPRGYYEEPYDLSKHSFYRQAPFSKSKIGNMKQITTNT